MNYIFQIGRLDNNVSELKTYVYHGKKVEAPISSIALKEILQEKEPTKVKLFYPVTLPLNQNLLKSDSFNQNFKEEIKNILNDKTNYLENPNKFFKSHPYCYKIDSFYVIRSIGEYENTEFCSTLDANILEMFIEIIDFINLSYEVKELSDQNINIYIDTSTGLNFYVSALIEAARHFYVYASLQNWANEKNIKVFLTFTDPIIGNNKKEFNIYANYELKYKVFFHSDLPSNNNDINKIAKSIFEEDRKKKKELSEKLNKFSLIYLALQKNVPLFIYYRERNNDNEIIDVISLLKEKVKNIFKNCPYTKVFDDKINTKEIIQLFTSLSLYLGIVRLLNAKGISVLNKEQGVDLEQLKKDFCDANFDDNSQPSIYNCFELFPNIRMLESEISNICNNHLKQFKKTTNSKEIINLNNKWMCLDEFYKKINKYLPNSDVDKKSDLMSHKESQYSLDDRCSEIDQSRFFDESNKNERNFKEAENNYSVNKTQIDPRNFFAHCGFEKSLTEIMITDNDNVYLRYIPNEQDLEKVSNLLRK